MLELRNISTVLSGVSVKQSSTGTARFMRLSDLSDLKAGRRPNLPSGELPEVARAVTIQQGDLIVAARGNTTDIAVADEQVFGSFISLDLYLVRPNPKKVEPQYLFAFLALPATQALFAVGKQGSSLARLPKEVLETTKIPLPPLEVQHSIAALACSFDEEGRLLRRLSDLNSILSREVIARAIDAATNPRARRTGK